MKVTRSDGSTFEVNIEPMNDGSTIGFIEPNTGLRLEVTTDGVWVIDDETYLPGLKFPLSILPAIWELHDDTPVRSILAELASCGRPPRYHLRPGDWLTNDQGWAKCEFRLQTRNPMNPFHILPCLDSEELAAANRQALDIPRHVAADLGHSAVAASKAGRYRNISGKDVDFSHLVETAKASKLSIAPDYAFPSANGHSPFAQTVIQVTNETTLVASRRLVDRQSRPLVLNFANGITPGGGFLIGARAQEETLCRSSALYLTLVGDRMYEEHAKRPLPDSTGWSIISPDVPVFREDHGSHLDQPWLLSFITCAAPYAPTVGRSTSAEMLRQRIHRVMAIAKAFGYETLILGAWGCGAFGNDPERTSADFRHALETEFRGAFSEIVFAITDWSPERRFLGPFRDGFAG